MTLHYNIQNLFDKLNISKNYRQKYVNESFPKYHLDILESLNEKYSLRDKIIIDIGGSNIPVEVMQSFGVKKFVCLDPVSKWGYSKQKNKCFGKPIYKLNKFKIKFNNEYSFIIDEDIENLDSSFFNKFDIAISISTFEHVTSLTKTMNIIYQILKNDGFLHSQYEPIFSCASGHHVYISKDLNFNNMPEINYFHLLYSKDEAIQFLKKIKRFDTKIKKEIIRQAYGSKILNRFLVNQHINAIYNSNFKKYILDYFYLQPVPEKIDKTLKQKYGNQRFDVRGIKLTAFKQ